MRKFDHHGQNHSVAKQTEASDQGQHYPINGQVIFNCRSIVHFNQSQGARKVETEVDVLSKVHS